MSGKSGRTDLLDFHRPDLIGPGASVPPLKAESRECIQNLASYEPAEHWHRLQYPKSRCAAVLVALFVGRSGDLYVLLSRRALTLRTYAGDTSLPGGKWEPEDRNLEMTARREAYEEIGLPVDRNRVPMLCALEPFLAGNQLIVTPVVVLILDNTLRPFLNQAEVASIFSHPLLFFLRSDPPFPAEPDTLEIKYHTHTDYIPHSNSGNRGHERAKPIRMHRFLTGREAGGTKPIFGLTAAILIRVATIGYAREPDFEVRAPGQVSQERRIARELKYHEVFRQAATEEGMNPDEVPDDFGPEGESKDGIEREGRRRRRSMLRWASRL